MIRMFILTVVLVWSNLASAAYMAMDPLTRVHAGLSLANNSSLGVSAGLDSRMTRFVYVDIGTFVSVQPPPEIEVVFGDDPGNWIVMRHAFWAAPGIRIPHSYGPGIRWDIMLRGGFATVWSQDASVDYDYMMDPAMLGGADFLVVKDAIGFRITGKVFGFKPFSQKALEELSIVQPQITTEVTYQW